jgi:acetyl esterase/lipase
MPLDPAIAEMLKQFEESDWPAYAECETPEQARQILRTLMVDLRDPATLAAVGSVRDDVVADSIPVRVYDAEVTGPCPTVVFFHGNLYAEALRAAGVKVVHREFPGLIHGFYGLEALSPAIAEATAWSHRAFADLLR